MLNECIPFQEGAYTQVITVHAGYAMTGKRLAGPLTGFQSQGPGLANDPLAANDGGNLQCPAAPSAGGAVSGVICWDVAITGKAPLFRGGGTILPITAGGTVTVGDLLTTDTAGRVVTAATGNVVCGKAHSSTTIGLDCVVELFDLNPAILSA